MKVGIIGAGAWGTALAMVANRVGSEAVLWSRNENVVHAIRSSRYNKVYLPDVFVDPDIRVTQDLSEVCDADTILLAIPAQYLRALCIMLVDMLSVETPLVIATKGIERGSLALMSEVVADVMPDNPLAILSGPNFAREIAAGLPAAATLACGNEIVAERIAHVISGRMFRLYHTDDLVGVQIGGAVKNVVAIACGICEGKQFGENAKAALITRGLAEINRLCLAKGGRHETLMGLAGVGDLMLTCSSPTSRNMALGIAIGQGLGLHEYVLSSHGVMEGVSTSESVVGLAEQMDVYMPISRAVFSILHRSADVDETITSLLERSPKPEFAVA